MNFRTTLLLLGFLVVLLLSLYIVRNGGFSGDASRQSVISSSLLRSANQLEIIPEDENERMLLVKSDDQWTVDGHMIDQNEWNDFVEALLDTKEGNKVSKNESNWSEYGLEDAVSTKIIFRDGEKELLKLFVGDSATSYRSFYYRKNDQPDVYLSSSSFGPYLAYDVSRWRDKSLFPYELEDLSSLTVRIGEDKWTFESSDGEWLYRTPVTGIVVDQDKIEDYWKDLSGLQATAFEADTSLFTTADNAVAIQLEGGEEYVLSIDILEGGDVVAQASGSEQLYRLSSDLGARLKPNFAPKLNLQTGSSPVQLEEVSE